jgi:hypothetical protein
VYADEEVPLANEPTAQSAVAVGGFAGSTRSLGIADGMIRIGAPLSGMLLLNPRYTGWDDDEEQAGLGLIFRRNLPGRVRLTLYSRGDYRETPANESLSTFSGGVDVRAPWYTLRLRGYVSPHGARLIRLVHVDDVEDTGNGGSTTTSRVLEQYEIPLSGAETEVGLKIPIPPWAGELRTLGGYHYRDGSRIKALKGWMTRLEYRPREQIAFEMISYFDENFDNSEIFWGGRITIPLGAGGASSHNAFWLEPLPTTPRSALTVTPLQENPALRTVTVRRPQSNSPPPPPPPPVIDPPVDEGGDDDIIITDPPDDNF